MKNFTKWQFLVKYILHTMIYFYLILVWLYFHAGNELFYYLFEGEPEPKNGFINLNDNTPGLGISINEKYKGDFKIIE